MATRTILHYPDRRLRTPGKPVTEFGPELAKLVEDMAETMYAAPGSEEPAARGSSGGGNTLEIAVLRRSSTRCGRGSWVLVWMPLLWPSCRSSNTPIRV